MNSSKNIEYINGPSNELLNGYFAIWPVFLFLLSGKISNIWSI